MTSPDLAVLGIAQVNDRFGCMAKPAVPFHYRIGDAYRTTEGMTAGGWRIIPDAEMYHVRLFGWDGLKGLSPIRQASEHLGVAKAAVKFGAKFFGNSAKPSGILSTVSNQDEKQQEQIRQSWNAVAGGKNQGGTAVLWGDWKWQSVKITAEESQFLNTQVHCRTDCGALFRVPAHMIGDTSRLSNSNHEQASLEFVTDTLRPYLSRFEVETRRKLLPRLGRKAGKYFAEFDVRERLRGDFQTTMIGLGLGRQWSFLTANDCRREIGENPIGPEGDILLYPLNMGNLEALLHPISKLPLVAAKAQLAPPPPPKPDPAAPAKPGKDAVEGEVVPAENRAALAQYAPAYIRLFRDGFGRVAAREERTSTLIQGVFGALLTSIQEQAAANAAQQFSLATEWNQAGERIVADAARQLTHRAASWTPDNADEAAGEEFRRVLKAIVTNTYREAGAAAAFADIGATV
jgi:hypothetical protein